MSDEKYATYIKEAFEMYKKKGAAYMNTIIDGEKHRFAELPQKYLTALVRLILKHENCTLQELKARVETTPHARLGKEQKASFSALLGFGIEATNPGIKVRIATSCFGPNQCVCLLTSYFWHVVPQGQIEERL